MESLWIKVKLIEKELVYLFFKDCLNYVFFLNDFLAKDYGLLQKENMSDIDKKRCSKIKNLSESILKNYNLFQQKEMNLKEFYAACCKIFQPIDQEVQEIIDSVLISMESYKKNKSRYLDEIKKENL